MTGPELYLLTGVVIAMLGLVLLAVWGLRDKRDPRELRIGQRRRVHFMDDKWSGKFFTIVGYGEYDGFDGEIRFDDGTSFDVMWKWIYENSEVIDG